MAVTVGHYTPVIPFCGLAVACSLVTAARDSAVTRHYLNFLFHKERNQYFMMKIPGSQSYIFEQLITAATHTLMLLLISSLYGGNQRVIYCTFLKESGIIYLGSHSVVQSHKIPKLSRQKIVLGPRYRNHILLLVGC